MTEGVLTQLRLRELLDYDLETGQFVWRFAKRRELIGKRAGTPQARGYIQIQVDGRIYLAHRLAWLYVHGAWPTQQIDHIDGDRRNNRVANLREASPGQNQQNRAKQIQRSGNGVSSKFVGVYRFRDGRWVASIRVDGMPHHLGYFDSEEGARDAYLAAKQCHHKFQPVPRQETEN
ncbi:HNH endonuclease [Xanthomonas sp. BRIP62411]|uniref:HNH endonuclease n=1 Tax=Xanthomonas sp. BRIP62411 TaxID=2182389 RepID=UPI000F8D0E8B|nr:HNH endonuclease [Xanthomonas sp. BRIP62411]